MNILRKTIFSVLFLAILPLFSGAQTQMTREEYIEKYKNIAIAHMQYYGIPASITMAQGILESNSGNSQLSRSSNNHFGIKCKKNWTGEKVYHDDDEKGECFRKYPSVEESYLDHAEFLDKSPRYDSLFVYSSTDYRSWARGLKAAGYATAPDYAERLIRIIEENKLYLLDRDQGEKLYAESHGAEPAVEAEMPVMGREDGVNPNAFRVTINAHRGYNVYRTNNVCYVLAKEDDKYEHIASLFEMSAKVMRRYNDVAPDAQPMKGDIVFIERKRKAWEGNVLLHTVRGDESLHEISQAYGIRLRPLARINKVKPNVKLSNGQTIKVR
ncbi:MAG: glucosaminidase domain-containing protein [Alistipes sp.]|nr:glucosaminidase domain-containing protein [Alistipes sp.]MBQ2703731.1 glucosaminidase domain-containing protein [Alistipes sp.]MBQ3246625.1 glucosaminidase domain-containing protein [Alistipes sp.]